MTAKNIKLFTAMQDYGQMIDKITFSVEGDVPQMEPSDFVLTNCFYDLSAKKSISGIKSVSVEGETVTLTMDKFLYRIDDFKITGKGVAEGIEITKTAAESVELLHSDWFDYCVENGVNYRLYTPERAYGPRPLVLFLHGGGGSGENNETQLTDTVGAIKLAERCPDMYIMAPQAPAGKLTMQEMFARMMSKGDPYNVHVGSDPCEEFDSRGWTRWYLGKIADIIRKMIAEGSVDSRRVYVIGMSMGGGGTLKMMSVAPDLFAAAVPICPSMNSESWPILNCLPNIPTYVVSLYSSRGSKSVEAGTDRCRISSVYRGRTGCLRHRYRPQRNYPRTLFGEPQQLDPCNAQRALHSGLDVLPCKGYVVTSGTVNECDCHV